MMLGLSTAITGSGGSSAVLADYALEFNGTDEYLSIALPNNELLASAGVTDFYSSGSAIAGWSADSIDWAGTTVGKTYTNTIVGGDGLSITKTISGLIIGQKYKLKLRFQSDGEFFVNDGTSEYFNLGTSSGEWNTVSKIFTATTTTISFTGTVGWVLDYASVKRDQGFDSNKDQEQILHSRNAEFNNAGCDWVAHGNHSFALSTVDKIGATGGSMLITATGAGRGSNLASGWNFTNWTVNNGTINDLNTFTSTAVGGVNKSLHTATVGKTYVIVYNLTTTALNITIFEDYATGGVITTLPTGASNGIKYFTATRAGSIFIRNDQAGVTDVTTFELYEVLGETTLPSANIESVVSGKKYTLEGFARLDVSSLAYGSDLASGWDFTSGWTANNTTINDNNTFTSSVVGGVRKAIHTATVGKIYKLVYNLTTTAATGVTIFEDYNTGGVIVTLPTGASSGTVYFKATKAGEIFIRNNISGVCDVTTFELYEATAIAPTLTAQLGTKSVISSALPIVAGTFTKFVLNFEATASEQSQDLKLYLSGAGSVFVDKLSLTQAYDMWVTMKEKTPTSDGGQDLLFSKQGASGQRGYYLALDGSSQYYSAFSSADGSGVVVAVIQAKTSTNYENIALLMNRTGNISLYLEGVLKQSNTITTVGKVINDLYAFTIGRLSYADLQHILGQISHLQIIRFENISQSTFNSELTGLQYPTGGGSEEVLRLTFQSGVNITECLKDYSPKNHTVSGVNIDISNRKRVIS